MNKQENDLAILNLFVSNLIDKLSVGKLLESNSGSESGMKNFYCYDVSCDDEGEFMLNSYTIMVDFNTGWVGEKDFLDVEVDGGDFDKFRQDVLDYFNKM